MALDPNNPLAKKYELMRQRVGQDAQAQGDLQSNALQRRQAQLGNLNSGAAIKQQQQVGEQVAMQKQKAVEGVDMAQAGEEAQQAQILQQQGFASSEREKAQGFSAGETEKQRSFQQKNLDTDQAFKEKVFGVESGFKQQQLDMASREAGLNESSVLYDALRNAMASEDPNAEKLALGQLFADFGRSSQEGMGKIDEMLNKKRGRSSVQQNTLNPTTGKPYVTSGGAMR